MNKGKGIGIFVAVIAVAIVVGIASLPDEVLLESPQLDASENLPSEMIPIEIVKEEPIEVVKEEPESPDESEGKVIKVTINDGVGAKMR